MCITVKPRQLLSDALHSLCENVYFQPPTGYQLKYPCIIYEFKGIEKRNADNLGYMVYGIYDILYITRDPDDDTKISIAMLPMCRMGTTYEKDNLYHYSYKIYH